MVNSKQRKIVTIVCIVLGVLLITGGIIGTLLYLNSNEYRFRMDAFVDKYKNVGETSFGNNLIWIRIYQGDDIYTKDFIVAEVNKTDDSTKLHYLDGATSKEISPEQVDANVRKRVEYLAGIFGTNCEVKKDRIIFDTKELSITKTEYLPPNIMEVSPRRMVYATDEECGVEFVFTFVTGFVIDNSGTVYEPYNSICLRVYKEVVDGVGNEKYNLRLEDTQYVSIEGIKILSGGKEK